VLLSTGWTFPPPFGRGYLRLGAVSAPVFCAGRHDSRPDFPFGKYFPPFHLVKGLLTPF